jgi:hypothetical protein
MAIVPLSGALLDDADAAIPLARYAQLISYPECQFFGVADAPGQVNSECRTIWVKAERDMVLKYLLEAQEEIEKQIRYPLKARWVEEDNRPYSCPVDAKWNKVIEGGVRAEEAVLLDAPVDLATDPATVGPIAGITFTDVDEVHVFHPSGTSFCPKEGVEIHPSCVTIAGGILSIEIPRCRLVREGYADNPRDGIDYHDDGNFEDAVDVYRVYNDPSTQAELVWPHRCNSECAACSCSEYTRDGCIYVRDGDLGVLDVLPATYSGGAWTVASGNCLPGRPERVRLNYRAGLTSLTPQAEDAILRLAHAKMPEEPCGCAVAQRLWARDRNVPKILTSERVNCPFGLNDGAWIAWEFAMDLRTVRMGVM